MAEIKEMIGQTKSKKNVMLELIIDKQVCAMSLLLSLKLYNGHTFLILILIYRLKISKPQWNSSNPLHPWGIQCFLENYLLPCILLYFSSSCFESKWPDCVVWCIFHSVLAVYSDKLFLRRSIRALTVSLNLTLAMNPGEKTSQQALDTYRFDLLRKIEFMIAAPFNAVI